MKASKITDLGLVTEFEGPEAKIEIEKGDQHEVYVRSYHDGAVSLWAEVADRQGEIRLVCLSPELRQLSVSGRYVGILSLMLRTGKPGKFSASVFCVAVGSPRTDPTRRAIATSLPELSIEERVRRELDRSRPFNPKPVPELVEGDELSALENYEIDDDETDVFFDDASALVGDRKRDDRVQQDQPERNSRQDGDRAGTDTGGGSPPAPAPADTGGNSPAPDKAGKS